MCVDTTLSSLKNHELASVTAVVNQFFSDLVSSALVRKRSSGDLSFIVTFHSL